MENKELSNSASAAIGNEWQEAMADMPAEPSAEQAMAQEVVTEAEVASLEDLFHSGEARPQQLTEAERRVAADRAGMDNILRMLGRAANEKGLTPDDYWKIDLSLDVADEVSAQLDDEDNELGAHDIFEQLGYKYDKLAKKAPTRERHNKYMAKSAYAFEQMQRFTDWKAKDRPKSAAEQKFDELSQIM